jgi:beta-glucosidase
MPGEQVFGVGTYSYWGGNLTAAVLNGTVPQWRVDDMAIRIMSAYFKVGRDRCRVPINFSSWTLNTTGYLHQLGQANFQQINYHINVQADHARVIREIGQRSTVLLKNVNGALPLKKPNSVAVIGEDAHSNPAGPNGCPDRNCNSGTLAMGWGSGTANFPYLVAPVDALRAQAANDHTTFSNFSNNYDLSTSASLVQDKSAALVFANADSGEAFITIDGNLGDRNNLTLWGNGDAVIQTVAANNKNTIVVLHTVGAVIIEAYKNHPNITALIWAGIPGQESGNAITDILYGNANPSGKSVFTWGKDRADWGTDILYKSEAKVPQQDFTEGVFIDYRHFDAAGIAPSYEFGFGLSYTTFAYSHLVITKFPAKPYKPNHGKTKPAPTFGTVVNRTAANAYPPAFPSVSAYVYPWIDSTTGRNEGSNGDAPPGSQDGTPQPKLAAGGSPGGNRGLWDVLYDVSATVTNTGALKGIEVVQLVSLTCPCMFSLIEV